MKTHTEKRIANGYISAIFLLLLSFLIGFYVNTQMHNETVRVIHSNNVLNQIEIVLSDVKDGETGMRGFAAVKDESFLQPFYNSEKNFPKNLNILKDLISDNEQQKSTVDSLRNFIEQKYKAMNYARVSFLKDGFTVTDTLRKLAYISNGKMDTVRSLSDKMKNTESKLLQQRNSEMQAFRYALNFINIATLVIAMLLVLYTIIAYRKENQEKHLYRTELEKKLEDLGTANIELIKLKQNEKFASTGRIARTMAHEVRNPLTNIALAAEQLKETVNNNEDTTLYFDMISRNCDRINQLVSELLNATKNIDLNRIKVSINEILDEALDLAKDRVTLQHIKIEKKYSSDICEVMVDIDQIKIALLNLIVNALEAMENNEGILHIETKGENDKCVIIIKDNGKGIDKDNIVKLFEPYYTNKPKGNGLGLTNTQNIILNHKGNIIVESEIGSGTTFTITLDFAE
jgi:signal transduction histidine kinase